MIFLDCFNIAGGTHCWYHEWVVAAQVVGFILLVILVVIAKGGLDDD
jgi:hypothetical protein